MYNLEKIISPMSVDDFIDGYLGKKACYIPGNADKFPGFFDWEQVNDIVNFSRPSREGIRLVHEKKPLEIKELANLAHWMVKGATLVINHVQQIDPVVSRFSTMLGSDMNSNINVNCYASYPTKQGFDNHYDTHDVFVVQTAGRKAWKVLSPTRDYPLDIDVVPKGNPPETDPYLECVLDVGDVLYIPRGHWHYAIAETPSVHLTISTQQRSGIEFLLYLAEYLRDNDAFLRQDFPIVRTRVLGGDRPDDDLDAHLDRFRQHMHALLDDEGLKESYVRFCMTRNPVPRNYQLPDLALIKDTIRPETRFRFSPDQKLLIRYDEETRLGELVIRGHILNLNNVPGELLQALDESLTEGGVITGDAIIARCGGMGWEPVRDMLISLYENGIIQLA